MTDSSSNALVTSQLCPPSFRTCAQERDLECTTVLFSLDRKRGICKGDVSTCVDVRINTPAFLATRLFSLTEHLNTVHLGEVLVCAARMGDGKPEDWHELYEDEDGPQIKKEAEWFLKKFPNMLPRLTEDGEKVWLPP